MTIRKSGPGWTLSTLGNPWPSWLGLQHLLHAVIGLWRRRHLGQLLTLDDHLDLVRVEHFALQQCERDSDQCAIVRRQNAFGGVVSLAHDAANFVVDFDCRGFAVIAMLGNLAAQENLLFLLAEGQRAKIA